jgi:hypothetical protein
MQLWGWNSSSTPSWKQGPLLGFEHLLMFCQVFLPIVACVNQQLWSGDCYFINGLDYEKLKDFKL